MSKIFNKIIASLMIIFLMSTNVSILINESLAASGIYENQSTKTNNSNVEFDSYFEGKKHEQNSDISSENVSLYLDVSVKNAGYLKNISVEFIDANFNINLKENNKYIQKVNKENNKIELTQIEKGENITLEIPIKFMYKENITTDYLNKEFKTVIKGNYIDKNGKTNSIEKVILNKMTWNSEIELENSAKINKYIPFVKEEKVGVLLQIAVNNKITDNKLPVKTSKTIINVPELEGIKPTNISVIANNTNATNGQENGMNFSNSNYIYDEENSIITISVENLEENSMIKWKKDASDEFLVTYIYEDENLYNKVVELQNKAKKENKDNIELNSEENSIKFDSIIKVEDSLYTSDEKLVSHEFKYENKLKEKVGELATTEIYATTEISKGYIYANYDVKKEENKNETFYDIKYITNIDYTNITDSIELISGIDKFKTEDNKEGLTTLGNKNYTYNKEIKISKDIFSKILGEEGKIEVFDNKNNKIGEINKDSKINEKNEYTIDISSNNENQITIKTSKPVVEGKIEIIITKAIAKNVDYSMEQIKEFKTLETSVKGNILEKSKEKYFDIKLIEPKSKATVEINKKQLSTVTENSNVEIRANLDTSSVYNALYKDPTITIELPSVIKDIKVNSIKAIHNEELKIKDAKLSEINGKKIININMEGNQTEYSIENKDIKGTSIIIDTNMQLDKLGTSQEAQINMLYTNNSEDVKENKTAKINIPIVAPTGVIATNEISNYKDGAENILAIEEKIKELTINTYSDEKNVTLGGQVINNYENPISDIKVLGRFPVVGNKNIDTNDDLESNFSMRLKSELKLSGEKANNAKVYYTSNIEATNDLNNQNNGWTQDISKLTEMKSYLIVIENSQLQPGEGIKFEYNAEIAKKLSHNNTTSTMYKVFYNNNSNIGTVTETKVSPIVKFTTGVGPELEVTLSSNMKEDMIVQNRQYVRYYVKIKNTGDIDAKNVKVNIPIPENTIYAEYEEINNIYSTNEEIKKHTISIDNIKKSEEKELSYELLVNERKIMSESTLSSYVTVTANNILGEIKSNEYNLQIKGSNIIPLTIINGVSTVEKIVYTPGQKIIYDVKIMSNTNESISNVLAKIPLPKDVKVISAYIKSDNGNITDGVQVGSDNITVNIPSIGEYEEKRISITFSIGKDTPSKFSSMIQVETNEFGTQYSNERIINIGKSEMSGKQLEPEKQYVKEKEEFQYIFEINTKGNADVRNFVLEDELPKELILKSSSFEIKTSEKNETINSVSGTAIEKDDKVYVNIMEIPRNSKIIIKLNVYGKLDTKQEIKLVNKAYIYSEGIEKQELNSTTMYMQFDSKLHDYTTEIKENRYKISGSVWLDENKNGMMDEGETFISGVQAVLLYKKDGQIVKDSNSGTEKIVTTGKNGEYEFTNLQNNNYLVVFLYDSGKYSITTYQKNGVAQNKNSDAIETNITYNGSKQIAGITDTIQIVENNVNNIDLGLYQDEKFDLSLQKYITKISLTTPTIGTAQYEYGDSTLEKVEILGQNAGKSSMVIEYKIVVKNEGGVAGYAKKIADYLPKDVGFNTELNKDWYLSETNGNIYNASLANVLIQPGETKELKLVLTKKITESSIGTTLSNQAEIYEAYNDKGLKDIDSVEANKQENEDDLGQADVLISLVTGKIIMYTGLIIILLSIITIGVIVIKKKVLVKRN